MFAVTPPSLLKSTNSKLFFARICKKKKNIKDLYFTPLILKRPKSIFMEIELLFFFQIFEA